LWGGIECTVNRVNDSFFDQLEQNGHAMRESDLELIADLGIGTLRYPVLWERTAPDGLASADWSWPDRRLARIAELGIDPVIGLLHHGSGPRGTSLIDKSFPGDFARYARAVATRYPWVTKYTPINEPLTTARFSALYGLWYPHARSDAMFARAVVNQLRAIELAMHEIQSVNPDAILVQTEDIGRVHSTPTLIYQADFENERRWVTFDVLCGTLDSNSRMWQFLHWAGIPEWELRRLQDECSPPAILGVNHYLTSERYLDEKVDQYPSHTHGGNARHRYADVEAVRVLDSGWKGTGGALLETWNRYRRAVALTEVHAGATRDEQLRWVHDAWTGALDARCEGADVVAITAWSLFGAFNWHTLLTESGNHYEPGAFDVRSTPPRPTALAKMWNGLAASGAHEHPALQSNGWWRRDERLLYHPQRNDRRRPVRRSRNGSQRTILISGARGTLGRAFAALCEERALNFRVCHRNEFDIANAACVEKMIAETRPWAVINAAGYVRVDSAESESSVCLRENRDGPLELARVCGRYGTRLLTFSSDLVFDGLTARPYVERDAVAPLCVYGRSKAEAEQDVLRELPDALVVRTSAFFGPWDGYNFAARTIHAARTAERFTAVCDETVSPTFVPDLVHAALDLLMDGESGIWHLANVGAVSWAEFARMVLQGAGYKPSMVEECSGESLTRPARRPRYSVLGSERGLLLASLDDAIYRFCRALRSNAEEMRM
jgi:dTDP-4-dehydrorhamnose reductase